MSTPRNINQTGQSTPLRAPAGGDRGQMPELSSISRHAVEKPSSRRSAGLPGDGRDVSGPSEAARRCGF